MLSKVFSLLGCVALALAAAPFHPSHKPSNDGNPVTGLPGSSSITDTMYSGFVEVDETCKGNLFYWYMESRNDPSTDPLVMWLTGGPGCSSELAVLFENGPFTVDSSMTLTSNPHSWNEVANVLYVDNPFGAGFSYTSCDEVKDETEMADDLYTFLQVFLADYPELQGRDFFITGESFGGHYVPAIANKVVSGNTDTTNIHIPLRGAEIGNGWVVPEIQFGSYAPFAYEKGLITENNLAHLNRTYQEDCLPGFQNSESASYLSYVCEDIFEGVLQYAGNINFYNIKLPCIGQLCYDFDTQTKYMNLPQTQSALGVNAYWATCGSSDITSADRISRFDTDLVPVLEAGVNVLIMNGKLDLICNYIGGDEWSSQFEWSGHDAFNAQSFADWTYNGGLAGQWRSANNFTALWVANAGHMVPHDQPAVALEILTQWISGQEGFTSS